MKVVNPNETPETVDARGVRKTLEEMLERAEHFDGVIVIALNQDGSQFLRGSLMNLAEKSLLLAFAQSWLSSLFCHCEAPK